MDDPLADILDRDRKETEARDAAVRMLAPAPVVGAESGDPTELAGLLREVVQELRNLRGDIQSLRQPPRYG